jgi:hypothetical protein
MGIMLLLACSALIAFLITPPPAKEFVQRAGLTPLILRGEIAFPLIPRPRSGQAWAEVRFFAPTSRGSGMTRSEMGGI